MQVELIHPFPFEALPRVWQWIESFREQVGDDFAPREEKQFIDTMWAKWPRLKTWGIVGDGELGGLILFEKLSPWLGTAHVVLKKVFQNRGVAHKACRWALGEMFREEGIGKLQFDVLTRNAAVGSLLINLGATREGWLKNHTLRDGKPIDVYLYGLTKARFEEKQNVVHVQANDNDQHVQPDAVADGKQHPAAEHPDDAVPGNAAVDAAAHVVRANEHAEPDGGALPDPQRRHAEHQRDLR